jgi:hypothetical protein
VDGKAISDQISAIRNRREEDGNTEVTEARTQRAQREERRREERRREEAG